MHYYKTLGKRSTSPHYLYYIFIHFIIIGLNAQTKLQYDAMVYLCLSNVLLIFEHDQSHVMIGRFNIHIKHKKNNFPPLLLSITNWVLHSHSQQYCARIEAYLLRDILPLKQFFAFVIIFFFNKEQSLKA
jgi:hypothetical protein